MEGVSLNPPTQRRLKFQDSKKVKEQNYEQYSGLSHIEKRVIANRSSDDTKTLRNIHPRSVVSKGLDVREHYKCISRPPGYHGQSNKGGTLKDKALNVGVLNWDHIDKWKWKHNQVGVVETGSHGTSSANNKSWSSLASKLYYESYAPSAKQRASITSTVGFVPGEPKKERIVCLLTPQKPISSGPTNPPSAERSSSGNYSHRRSEREEAKEISSLSLKDDKLHANSNPARVYETKKVLDMLHKSSANNLSETELYSEIKKTISSMRSVESPGMPKKSTISDQKIENKVEMLMNSSSKLNYQVCPQKNENIIVLLNRDSYSSPSGDYLLPGSQESMEEVFESTWSTASDVLSDPDISSNHVSGLSQSSPQPHYSEVDGRMSTDPNADLKVKNVHTVMVLPKVSRSSSKVESSDFFHMQGRKLIPEHGEYSPVGCSLTSDHTYLDQATQSSRNPSPLRRISNGFSRMRKSLSSKDNPLITLSNSKRFPVSVGVPSSPVVPSKDKSEAPIKARSSSPLRRLIDPILKPKGVMISPRADDHTGSRIGHKMLDKVSETASKLSQIERKKKDTVQALLQCSAKNGLPMFKFVAKKQSEALVATMVNTPAHDKPDSSLNFTLYSVNEMTKNSSWKYQGKTGKNCGYLYSIVGQMKICIPSSDEMTDDVSSGKHFSAVESTLFGLLPNKADQETMKVKPTGELAALIIKTPNDCLRIKENGNDCEKYLKKFSECFSEDSLSNMTGSYKRLSTTVILPAGVHSMPNKGAPSPLIHRWKSGGSCDCGGWDIGCNLTILHNVDDKEQCELAEQSQVSPASECLHLLSQTGAHGKDPLFRLTPYNKGIYSVEFKPSSMSDLQAFFISLTVLSSLVTFDLSTGTE